MIDTGKLGMKKQLWLRYKKTLKQNIQESFSSRSACGSSSTEEANDVPHAGNKTYYMTEFPRILWF